jgi:hypothetical protein
VIDSLVVVTPISRPPETATPPAYNTRKMMDAERMALSIHGIVGKRLTSRRTNSAAKAQA